MRLRIEPDRIELEATHRVVLPEAAAGASGHDSVIVRNGRHRCAALVAGTSGGSIAMDKYLRVHLRAKVGDEVEVEAAALRVGSRVSLLVPAELERAGFASLIKDTLVGKPLSVGQRVPLFVTALTGDQSLGEVVSTDPAGPVVVARETALDLTAGRVTDSGVSYDRIGGLRREIGKIREAVEYPLRTPEVFRRLGIAPPRGVLLHGPPGTGKTLITKALAHEIGASVHTIQGPEIVSHWYGGAERNLREVFEAARAQSPAIVLIDEIDSIAARRDRTNGEVEHRVVATLLTLMDGLAELKDVVVIGTTNRLDSLDSALRRPGRFEHEIHIGVPDTEGREEILAVHTRRMPLAAGVETATLAERTHGFVGADLAALCRQAAYQALRRANHGDVATVDEHSADELAVGPEDFARALASARPSAMREVLVEAPRDVSWDLVGGADATKRLLIENVVFGITRRAAFLAVGIKPAKGILLHGPPGTGKTLLAKVVARESGANFIGIRGPELRSKWFGESEQRVRSIFAKAREVAPCIVFFDEIDAVGAVRGHDPGGASDSVVNQLLAELDGIESNDSVAVLGTTNRVDIIDPALLRPGRFEYQVLVPLPDREAREAIFRVHLAGKPVAPDASAAELATLTGGLSGADIAEVCRLAALDALRRGGFEPAGVTVTAGDLRRAVADLRAARAPLQRRGEAR